MPMLQTLYNQISQRVRPFKKAIDWLMVSFAPKSVVLDEGTLALNPRDPALLGLFAFNAFEPFMTKVFREQIRPGDIVVDIGANIGYYTLIASRKAGNTGNVIAYEPEPENCIFLEKNISANNLNNVIVKKHALGDRTGKANLYLSNDNKCTHALVANRPSSEKISIDIDTLDHSLSEAGINRVDVIKMDIEGAESIAIHGMLQTLKNNPSISVFTEFYPSAIVRMNHKPINFLMELKRAGFSLWVINENKCRLEKLIEADIENYVRSFPKGEAVSNIFVSKSPPSYITNRQH